MGEMTPTRRTVIKSLGIVTAGALSATTATAASRREVELGARYSGNEVDFEAWFTSTDVEGENDVARDNTIGTKNKNNESYGYVSVNTSSDSLCQYSIPSDSFVHLIRVNSGKLQFETGNISDSNTESDVELHSMSEDKADYHVSVSGDVSPRDNVENGSPLGNDKVVTDVNGNKRMNGRVIDGEDTYDISGQFVQMYLDPDVQLERYA
ncbi:hypothetical protein [Halorhabdus amylolytica]|uniref:hypothetical protein n=1 Tax=Halorhabdus amylolytica TaxID=2559573 RepID=UPI0010AA9BE7|nr:hypothetical protein [Halorhabdus amylolytica]